MTDSTITVQPSSALALAPAPQLSPVTAKLSEMVATGQTRTLVCRNLLIGTTLTRAQQEAAEILPKMLVNSNIRTTLGLSVLASANALSDVMLKESQERISDVPVLQNIMRQFSRDLRDLSGRYDPKNPKAREKYENAKGSVLARIGLGKTFLEELFDDIKSLDQRFNDAIERLNREFDQLRDNIGYYDQFALTNEEQIDGLIYQIAVMEFLRDMVAQQASGIKVGDASLGDRQGDEKANLLGIVTLLENKISAFQGRLWGAWAMVPHVRASREMNENLADRITNTIYITIPNIKMTIDAWLRLGQAQRAAMLTAVVDDLYNESFNALASATSQIVTDVTKQTEKPALLPETIQNWSKEMTAMTDAMLQILAEGAQQRAALQAAIVEGKEVLDANTGRLNEARLERLLESASQASPLQIAHSVPASS